MRYILIFILIFTASSSRCFSQSYYGVELIGAKIDSMYMITVSSPPEITFNGANDYVNGKVIDNFATISIKCNYNWQLGVRASTAFFTATGGGASTNMPCSVLKIKRSASPSYLTLSTVNQILAAGSRGSASVSGNSFTIDADINPGFSYNGGTYSIVLTYTLTKQ